MWRPARFPVYPSFDQFGFGWSIQLFLTSSFGFPLIAGDNWEKTVCKNASFVGYKKIVSQWPGTKQWRLFQFQSDKTRKFRT